jgi:transcriptional regulator with XRE-family HTH domain
MVPVMLMDQIRQAVEDARPKGLSDYALAQRLGWPRSVLSRFLAGGNVTPERLDQLAEVFGLTVRPDRATARRNLGQREAA